MIPIPFKLGLALLPLLIGLAACRAHEEVAPVEADDPPAVHPEIVPAEPEVEPEVDPPPAEPEVEPAEPDPPRPESALLDPSLATERAPDRFRVRFETTRGPFTVEAVREWAPRGTDRFYNLVRIGFFEDLAFFRVIDGFVIQFGISGNPEVGGRWRTAALEDEPVRASNRRGYITYAMGGPNSRTTQLFINLADNARLDDMGFAPFGQVVEGMGVVDSLYSEYGEGAPRGRGPAQDRIHSEGNRYLREHFPRLDYIVKVELIP